MTWTSMQQKVFVGKDVDETCKAYGHFSNSACICTTECPNDMVDAVTQANELRKVNNLRVLFAVLVKLYVA